MEQLSFEEAKRLSILKWKILSTYEGEFTSMFLILPKECINLLYCCGFCERWRRKENDPGFLLMSCFHCEFGEIAGKCSDEGHSLYALWEKAHSSKNYSLARKHAKKILKVLENLEE